VRINAADEWAQARSRRDTFIYRAARDPMPRCNASRTSCSDLETCEYWYTKYL
jgi:hypothetical protein